jgi:hypothetical protein
MNRMLEVRERVAQYGLALHGADREALDMARGNLEFYAYSDLRYLLDETARLRADLAAMTAERDAWQRRAVAAEKDIHDMLYDATLLVDNGLCDWCERWDNELCWSNDCKAECKWRGPDAQEGV